MVLLKNEGSMLPLKSKPGNVAVIGPSANDPDALLGNYNGIPPHIITPLEGLERAWGETSCPLRARRHLHGAIECAHSAECARLRPSPARAPTRV